MNASEYRLLLFEQIKSIDYTYWRRNIISFRINANQLWQHSPTLQADGLSLVPVTSTGTARRSVGSPVSQQADPTWTTFIACDVYTARYSRSDRVLLVQVSRDWLHLCRSFVCGLCSLCPCTQCDSLSLDSERSKNGWVHWVLEGLACFIVRWDCSRTTWIGLPRIVSFKNEEVSIM